jgi:hypothetical protein
MEGLTIHVCQLCLSQDVDTHHHLTRALSRRRDKSAHLQKCIKFAILFVESEDQASLADRHRSTSITRQGETKDPKKLRTGSALPYRTLVPVPVQNNSASEMRDDDGRTTPAYHNQIEIPSRQITIGGHAKQCKSGQSSRARRRAVIPYGETLR